MTDTNRAREGLSIPADAEAVRDQQVDRALRRLENLGELTPAQRATVEQMGDRLTQELLALFDAPEMNSERADGGESEHGAVLQSG